MRSVRIKEIFTGSVSEKKSVVWYEEQVAGERSRPDGKWANPGPKKKIPLQIADGILRIFPSKVKVILS